MIYHKKKVAVVIIWGILIFGFAYLANWLSNEYIRRKQIELHEQEIQNFRQRIQVEIARKNSRDIKKLEWELRRLKSDLNAQTHKDHFKSAAKNYKERVGFLKEKSLILELANNFAREKGYDLSYYQEPGIGLNLDKMRWHLSYHRLNEDGKIIPNDFYAKLYSFNFC